MNAITHVWIEPGCICCQACVQTLPEVFAFPDDTAVVLGAVRADGQTSRNQEERSPLNAEGLEYEGAIYEAAFACPVEVIHLDSA